MSVSTSRAADPAPDNWQSLRRHAGGMLRGIRTCLAFLLDGICLLAPRAERKTSVVVRLDAIGDFFIWMQSGAENIANFARRHGRHSVLVANPAWSAYARETGLWDTVIDVSPVRFMRDPIYRLRTLLQIRRLGVTLLVQPRHARVFMQEDAIARTSGAVFRVGSAASLINTSRLLRRWGDRYYDQLIEVNMEMNVHEIRRNSNFVMCLTGEPASRYKFERTGTPRSRTTIAVAVGAGQAGRIWPINKLAVLLKYLKMQRPHSDILLLGASSEQDRAGNLEARSGVGSINFVGKTSLSQLIEIISASELVICNDSSAYHIAMAVGSPVICFLGGGHFGWYAPYPEVDEKPSLARVLHVSMDCFWCNWQCRYERSRSGAFVCVSSIPIESAIHAVDSLLGIAKQAESQEEFSTLADPFPQKRCT